MLRRARGTGYVSLRVDGAYVTASIPGNFVKTKVLHFKCILHRQILTHSLLTKFADECMDDSDCGNKGSCIDIMATKFPRRQCFCNPGWFGESCSQGKIHTCTVT